MTYSSVSNEWFLLILCDHHFLVYWPSNTIFTNQDGLDIRVFSCMVKKELILISITYYELKTSEGSDSPPIPAFIWPEPYIA